MFDFAFGQKSESTVHAAKKNTVHHPVTKDRMCGFVRQPQILRLSYKSHNSFFTNPRFQQT